MDSSKPWEMWQGRASSPRGDAHAERSGGRPGGPILAVLALGSVAILAWVASERAGATRADGPAAGTPPRVVPSEAGPEPAWQTDYDRTLALAAARKRPALLRFTAEWCPPCRVMDRSVFPDREVAAALAERVIPVKLDIDEDRNAELAERYGVRGVPTLLLVDANGAVLARGGFMSAEALLNFLRGK